MTTGRLRIAVGIATAGRPDIAMATVAGLAAQSRPADRIIVCPASPQDFPGAAPPGVEVVTGPRGLPHQRNAILGASRDCDIAVFFDDDFVPSRYFLERTEARFLERPELVVLTGRVIADGILGPGIALEAARAQVRADDEAASGTAFGTSPTLAAYGCNMAVRLAPIHAHGIRFDERLPLYAWLEDWDFSAELRRATGGEVLRDEGLRGVHMGHKSGRTPGVKLGYSQIANPVYLAGKGALPKGPLYRLIRRNLLANMVKSLVSEPHIDRRGRLRGNLLGLWDALRGRADPGRIERLS
jgi:GT2 family glycosyltransferase